MFRLLYRMISPILVFESPLRLPITPPSIFCWHTWDRTKHLLRIRQMLYRMSYVSMLRSRELNTGDRAYETGREPSSPQYELQSGIEPLWLVYKTSVLPIELLKPSGKNRDRTYPVGFSGRCSTIWAIFPISSFSHDQSPMKGPQGPWEGTIIIKEQRILKESNLILPFWRRLGYHSLRCV